MGRGYVQTRYSHGDAICVHCNETFTKKNINSKYCSFSCRKAFTAAHYDCSNMPSAVTGAIGELLISADLLKRGYAVFRALSASCLCDLMAIKDGQTLRVEVTKGRRTMGGKIGWPPHDQSKYDVLALVFNDGEIKYLPGLESIGVSGGHANLAASG